MTKESYEECINKYLDQTQNPHSRQVVEIIGTKLSLNEGLNLAKGIIENYFDDYEKSKRIIRAIEKEMI